VCAINAPLYGESKKNLLDDLALSVGATVISSETGVELQSVQLNHLGGAKTVEIQKLYTTTIDGFGKPEEIVQRINFLQDEIQQSSDLEECQLIQDRINRLSGGIAIIRIGGATNIEVTEKRFRIDDALEAVRSAQVEGILPGGGNTLWKISENLNETTIQFDNEDQVLGMKIVQKAIQEPFKKIISNAGLNAEVVSAGFISKDICSKEIFNVKNKKMVDAFEAGILDPTKVVRCALQNAASAAIALLTTDCAIINL